MPLKTGHAIPKSNKHIVMNTLPSNVGTENVLPKPRKWGVIKVGFLIVLAMLCSYTVYGMVFNGDIKAARKAVASSVPGDWNKKFDFGVGPIVLGLARTVVSFIDDVPAEAKVVLHSVKGAGVSIYHLREGAERPARESVLVHADKAMAWRGWERLVGVTSQRDVVAVYIPSKMKSVDNAAVCVLVNNGNDLIVVSARANLDEIMTLAMDRLDQEPGNTGNPWSLIRNAKNSSHSAAKER